MKKVTTLSMLVALSLCTTSVFAATTKNVDSTHKATTATAVVANNNQNALTGVYLAGNVGISFQRAGSQQVANGKTSATFGSKDKSTFAGNVAVGYNFESQFNLPVRVELAYTASANAKTTKATDHMKVGLQTLMVNGYYDIYNSTPFTPYVGLGIGYAHAKFSQNNNLATPSSALSKGNNKFAVDATVGVNYAINQNLSANLAYTYTHVGKLKAQHATDSASTKLSTQNVLVGLRYSF